MKFKSLAQLFLGAHLLISPMTPEAAASCVGLSLEDKGGGEYKIVARGLIKVGAIDFTLTYDKASLSSPKVARGDLAEWLIFVPNIVETSGTVRVAMVNEPPVSGSGTVATVTFIPVGKSWGKPALTCMLTGLDDSNQQISSPLTSATEEEQAADTSENSGDVDGGTDSGETVQSDTGQHDSGSSQEDAGQQTVPTQPTGSTPQVDIPPDTAVTTPDTTQQTGEIPQTGTPPQTATTPQSGTTPETTQQTTNTQQGGTTQQDSTTNNSGDSATHETVTTPYVVPGTINVSVAGAFEEQQSPSEQPSPNVQDPLGEQPAPWQSSPDVQEEIEEYEPPVATTSVSPSAPVPSTASTAQEQKYAVYSGVLQRFKDYTGDITPKALMALFDQPVAATIKQDPPICIADGNATLMVLVELPASGSHAPNFALRGASLKSLKKQGDNRWVMEAIPDAGRVEATLTIVNGEQVIDYPFTVAPRADVNVDRNRVSDEADFSLFLSKAGADQKPAYDLNGDGSRDYVDDYIYTANYLEAGGDRKDKKK